MEAGSTEPGQPSPYADNGGRPRSYDVQPWRKWAYYGGGLVSAVGLLMFMSVFVVVFMGFGRLGLGAEDPLAVPGHVDKAFRTFPLSLVGFVLIAVGRWLRGVGREGLAGSGLVLSPQGEARDAEPWQRSKGAQKQMELEEVPALGGLAGAPAAAQVVKVRCRACGFLDSEDATFCSGCGQRL